ALKIGADLRSHFAQMLDFAFHLRVLRQLGEVSRLQLDRVQIVPDIVAELPDKLHDVRPRHTQRVAFCRVCGHGHTSTRQRAKAIPRWKTYRREARHSLEL